MSRPTDAHPEIYRVSWSGRLRYAVLALANLVCLTAVAAVLITRPSEVTTGFLVFVALLIPAFVAHLIYVVAQGLRRSPRFVLSDEGFEYRGLVRRFFSRWDDLEWFSLSRYSLAVAVVLRVRFTRSPSPLRSEFALDVSGLAPDHRHLAASFRRMAPHACPPDRRC